MKMIVLFALFVMFEPDFGCDGDYNPVKSDDPPATDTTTRVESIFVKGYIIDAVSKEHIGGATVLFAHDDVKINIRSGAGFMYRLSGSQVRAAMGKTVLLKASHSNYHSDSVYIEFEGNTIEQNFVLRPVPLGSSAIND